jgi:hypothetical protein
MHRPGDRPTLAPIGASGAPVLRVVAAVVALVALAVLKPWGGAGPETPGTGPGATTLDGGLPSGPAALSAVEPTPRPTPNPDEILCLGDGWRLVTLQTYGDRQTRTWVVVEPVSAVGPEDTGIPVTRLVEGNVSGLGFCDNAAAEPAGSARILAAYWLGAGADGYQVRWLGVLRPYHGRVPLGLPAAILYDPPDDLRGVLVIGRPEAGSTALPAAGAAKSPRPTIASDGGWPPGRYVFLVASGGIPRWFGLDLVWPPPNAPASLGAIPSDAHPSASARAPATRVPSVPSASASAGPVPSAR